MSWTSKGAGEGRGGGGAGGLSRSLGEGNALGSRKAMSMSMPVFEASSLHAKGGAEHIDDVLSLPQNSLHRIPGSVLEKKTELVRKREFTKDPSVLQFTV